MKVDLKEHTVTIKDTQGDLTSFLIKVTNQYKTYEKYNIIIDVSRYDAIAVEEINGFLPLSRIHKKTKKSFVIIAKEIDFNAVSDKLTLVPTALEAHDIIEMEEIERDLGF
jgi:hypothetical protein